MDGSHDLCVCVGGSPSLHQRAQVGFDLPGPGSEYLVAWYFELFQDIMYFSFSEMLFPL